MSLANKLLNMLNESNVTDSNMVNEARKKESNVSEEMTLPEYFVSVFNKNLESIELSLDESSDNSDLYVDTEISGIPLSFRFYLENNSQPMLDVIGFNESTDEGIVKSIKLSKKMVDDNGDLLIEENLKHMPNQKIIEAVDQIVPQLEFFKTVTRLVNGQVKKAKIAVSSSDLMKKKKMAQLYYKQHMSKIKTHARKYAAKLARVGRTSAQVTVDNKRRMLLGKDKINKFGKQV